MTAFAIVAALLFANDVCHEENPFKRWFSTPDVVCAQGELQEPAFLSVRVREGQRAVAYAPKFAVAYPTAARSAVPAATELWVFVVEKNVPVGVFVLPPIDAAAERELDARVAPPSAVVGWIQVSPEDRKGMENARGLSTPSVHIGSKEARLSPLSLLNGSFVLVRDVPAGTAQIELAGRGWLPQKTTANVKSAFTAVDAPLLAQPSATLILNWSSSRDVVDLNSKIGVCGSDDGTVARYAISVARCASRESEQCDVVRKEEVPPGMNFGSLTFEGLVPGSYRTELRFGRLPAVIGGIDLAPAQIANTVLSARYVEIYGSLTLGGKALADEAAMKFPGGVGFSPRDGSDYHAVLLDRVPLVALDTRIDVAACSGSPKTWTLADATLFRPGRLDVDIPDNELTIEVEDTFTHERINGATISYDVMSKREPKRPVVRSRIKTTAEAPVRIAYLPERDLQTSVSAAGYERSNVPTFSISKSEKRSLDVKLVPLRGTEARLISREAFENATIMWFVSPSRVDRAEVTPDGAFTYEGGHDDQLMAVVSASHPLWISRMPQTSRREAVEIRFPDGALSRSFDVVARAGYVGLNIGQLRVPSAALQLHQQLRNLTLRPPVRFRDIAETAPIEVTLGPNFDEVVSRKKLEPGATKITFE